MHQTGNLPSSNTIGRTTPTSGTSNLPNLFKYPKFINYNSNQINGLPCYIFPHYGNIGLSILIYRKPSIDSIVVICGDWDGNKFDVSDQSNSNIVDFLNNSMSKLCETIRTIGLEQAQLFFIEHNGEFSLVDIQTEVYKFASPGMLSDIFKSVCCVLPHKKFEIINDRIIKNIESGIGEYEGDLIIKPSKFRTIDNNPMYVEVIR